MAQFYKNHLERIHVSEHPSQIISEQDQSEAVLPTNPTQKPEFSEKQSLIPSSHGFC